MTDDLSWAGPENEIADLDAAAQTLTRSGWATECAFGDIPDGWTITLRGPQSRADDVVTAASVGPQSVLVLDPGLSRTLRIEAGFKRIRVAGGNSRAKVVLTHDDVEVTVGAGKAHISGTAARCTLRVHGDSAGTPVGVASTVPVSAVVELIGALHLDAPTTAGATFNGLAGSLQMQQDVSGVEVISPGLACHFAGVIAGGSKLEVASLRAAGISSSTVQAATSIRATETISDSRLEVTNSGPGAAIWLIRSNSGEPKPVDLALELTADLTNPPNMANWAQKAGSGRRVTNSQLICAGEGDIVVGEVEATSIRCEASVLVGGTSTFHPQADDRPACEAGREVVLAGSCELVDGASVTAGRTLAVAGVSGNGALTGDNVYTAAAVNGVQLYGDRIFTAGDLVGAHIEAEGLAVIRQSADKGTFLLLKGDGEIADGFEGRLSWTTATSKKLTLHSCPRTLTLNGPAPAPSTIAWASGAQPQNPLLISGKIRFVTESAQSRRNQPEFLIQDVTLNTPDAVLVIEPGGPARVAAIKSALGAVLILGAEATVDVGDATGLTLQSRGERNITLEVQSRKPESPPLALTVAGPGTFRVLTDIDKLHAKSKGNGATSPWLDVPASGRIFELTGDARLKSVEGLIAGRAGKRQRQWWPWSTATEDTRAPRIHDINKAAESTEGLVVNVDPTCVPYHHLDHADSFQIFEPDTVALMDFTRQSLEAGDPHHVARRNAYQAQKIAEMVAGSSASGGARSAASWTAARTHHQALTGARGERALRSVHRILGYSQRPGPPLLTFLLVTLAWTQAQWVHLTPNPGRGAPGWLGSFWHMALLPASAVSRLPEKSGDFEYLFGNLGAHTVAFVTMGVPLVFFFIALRHFLAAPAKRK